MTIDELSSALADRGLITEPAIVIDANSEGGGSPWYVQVMMGCCAWIAGLFLFGFLIAAFSDILFRGHDRWGALMVIGILICCGATAMYAKASQGGVFLGQFALATSYAGQIGVVMGLGGLGNTRTALWGMVILEVILTVVVRNRLHRFLTAFSAVIAWALATHELIFRELPGVNWFTSHTDTYEVSMLPIVLWIAIWAPVAYAACWLVRNEAWWMAERKEAMIRPATYGLIAGLSIAPLATHPGAFWMAIGLGGVRDFTDGAHGSTALWPLLAILLDLLGIALAFALRNRPLIGVAIIFGLFEVSGFYYVLGFTLLVKSIVMIVLGAGLMLTAQSLRRAS